jgi:hypothetical protein
MNLQRSDTPQARRSLNFSSSVESRTDDSERIIIELCREISDLRKEARGKSPAKERSRKRLAQYDQESSGPSSNAQTDVWAETPSPSEEAPRSAYQPGSVQGDQEKHKCSDGSISEHRDKGVLPPSVPKKKARRGEQRAVWKALDLVSLSPFFEEIECAELSEKFTAPCFEVYND